MMNEFALDLKVARRKSGLSQKDCAHLLDCGASKISLIEAGKQFPSVKDICTLSLVYGRSFESLFSGIFKEAREDLRELLTTIPEDPNSNLENFNRHNTLNALSLRLDALTELDHEC